MTLAAVWIEHRDKGNQPLCFASDSRTTPGPIDGVTKVMLFGREDVAGVWAGDYRYATMLWAHLDAVFTSTDAMRRRDVDLRRAFQQARKSVERHISAAINPRILPFQENREARLPEATTVLLGGWSVIETAYVLYRIDYRPAERRWRHHIEALEPDRAIFIGDGRARAKKRAKAIRKHRIAAARGWRMEPLAAIHLARDDPASDTVGGDLQMAKVFMHGSARAFGFVEPIRDDRITVRATEVNTRAAKEMAASALLVDLSAWVIDHGSYLAVRSYDGPPIRVSSVPAAGAAAPPDASWRRLIKALWRRRGTFGT